MSTSPSNLKLALDAYEAQQRRQAALVEAQRIGTLIHIQEQQLLAAKYLAKQRKSQRRRAHANANANNANANSQATTPPATEDASECAIDEDEEDLFEPITPVPAPAPAPICPSLAARRAARSASKRTSSSFMHPVLESIPEPDCEPQLTDAGSASHSASHSSLSLSNNINTDNIPAQRFASHKRRPQEPYATLASRSQWKPDSLARVCDNELCKKPFSLFGNQSRHHCRRCGNIFCAACLTHTEVLYDMQRSQWDAFPEALLASIFPQTNDAETTKQDQRASSSSSSPSSSPSCESVESRSVSRSGAAIPTSPASFTSTNLSSSVESGSSRASTSSSSYFPTTGKHANSNSSSSSSHLRPPITDPLHAVNREPVWCKGTNAILPSPIPSSWRDALLDIVSEEKVCEECHDELWDRPTPAERVSAKRQFFREREEMAWALTVVGLDCWEGILRRFGLTLRARKEGKGEKERRGSESTAGSSRRSARHQQQHQQQSVEPQMPTGAPGVKPELGLDYLDRPTYPHVYAWVTPPPCIRFTSNAFKPSPSADPSTPTTTTTTLTTHSEESTPTPSPFGMLKSPAKFLPPPLPPAYLAAQHAASQRALLATVPRGAEREEVRWERYQCAVKELVKTAYRRGVPCDHLDGGVLGVRYLVEPTPLEVVKGEVVKRALDLAARWRGDPVGC